jgi:hypothetical protein
MEEINRIESEAGKTRAKLEAVIEKAKATCERLQDQTVAAAKATDQTIREKPYHAMGVRSAWAWSRRVGYVGPPRLGTRSWVGPNTDTDNNLTV